MSPVEAAWKAVKEHEATRPDHRKATRPDAPPALRKAWSDWCEAHRILKAAHDMAMVEARSGWRDAKGKKVRGMIWKASPTAREQEGRSAHPAKGRKAA